jgi:hypothetical protein
VDILPSLNITQDPRIEDVTRQMANDLCRFGPQELRDSALARDDTAAAAEAILAKMAEFAA